MNEQKISNKNGGGIDGIDDDDDDVRKWKNKEKDAENG